MNALHLAWWSTYNAVLASLVNRPGNLHSMDRMHVLAAEAAERAHGFTAVDVDGTELKP